MYLIYFPLEMRELPPHITEDMQPLTNLDKGKSNTFKETSQLLKDKP